MVMMKTRFNRQPNRIYDKAVSKEILKNSIFQDEIAYDVRTDTYQKVATRNIVECINASADALLSVGERVQAFILGDMSALSVDRSGIYTDLNGLPTNEHEIKAVIDSANAIVREKGASGFKDAFDKITGELLEQYESAVQYANKDKKVEVANDECEQ